MKNKYLKYYIFFFSVYFLQGIWSIPSQSLAYLMKDTWLFSVSKMEYIAALLAIPWILKPLFGFISDTFAIGQLRRTPYLIINYLLIFLCCLYVIIFGLDFWSLIVIGLICNYAFAFSDVLCDGCMVEVGQKHNILQKIQSLQWGAIEIASLLVGIGGACIAQYLHYKWAYLALLLPVGIILLYIGLGGVQEEKSQPKSILSQKRAILEAFKDKQLLFAILFLFCLWFSPSFSTAIFFKMRDTLHFNKIFIGLLGTTGSGFGILGALIFYKIGNKFDLKKMLFWVTILSGITTLCYLYYPNWIIALIYAILGGIFGMICHLTILTYAAKITPKNVEAFVFACVMGILNLAGVLSSLSGGWLFPKIGLNGLIILSSSFTFLCLIFIPKLRITNDK